MIIEFGAAESRLLRLRRLIGSRSRAKQFHLRPIGVELRLNSIEDVVGLGMNSLQLVSISIELRIAETRTGEIAFQAVEIALPALCRGLEIDTQFPVHAFDDVRSVDPQFSPLKSTLCSRLRHSRAARRSRKAAAKPQALHERTGQRQMTPPLRTTPQ